MTDTRKPDLAAALDRARRHAPFLKTSADRFPDIAAALQAGAVAEAEALVAKAGEGLPPMDALRRERGALAFLVAILDLGGAWDLTQVTGALSAFADGALDRAIEAAFAERDVEAPGGFAVLALGKHGSRELNYSSDIDPILIFDPETLPRRAREEPAQAAVRIGRRVVEILSQRTGEGYVFRVDLRLRPSPEATPIVLPVDAAISHYESSALAWEQAAFIRARAAAGDRTLGQHFLRAIRPFVWRRSLDFGTIRAMGEISRRIRSHHAAGQRFGPGYDLKRGQGGIREIEFFAQIHQLIHGGREPQLRVPDTRGALAALAEAGRIDAAEAGRLANHYTLLRTIEHRLQMANDRQTHSLPEEPEALAEVAQLHGLADGAILLAELAPAVADTAAIYSKLLDDHEDEGRLPLQAAELRGAAEEKGFSDPQRAAEIIARWRSGTLRALRSQAALDALERLLPGLMAALARAPDPLAALIRLDAIVSRLPSALNFFDLLEARPAVAELLTDILSHAPMLADALGLRPALLDALIDWTRGSQRPDVEILKAELGRLEPGEDYQVLLDRVRQKVGDRRFRLGVDIIRGARDPLEVARGYSDLAEAALGVLADATIAEFEGQHGRVPGSELVILAYGRFGGQALTQASDLDLVFLFTGTLGAESDGARPLGITHYYNRLAQRVGNALSVPTAAGALYEVDTRLRPSGTQGPLVVSIESFLAYQRENAWTWEHMALTRARPVYGTAAVRARLSSDIVAVLEEVPNDIAADAVAMRREMMQHKPPAGELDAKLIPGGLVDLEFLVHVTQFAHKAGFVPQLEPAIAQLVAGGHLPPEIAQAHAFLARLLVTSRLITARGLSPDPATQPIIARAVGEADWDQVLDRYAKARQCVLDHWGAIMEKVDADRRRQGA